MSGLFGIIGSPVGGLIGLIPGGAPVAGVFNSITGSLDGVFSNVPIIGGLFGGGGFMNVALIAGGGLVLFMLLK